MPAIIARLVMRIGRSRLAAPSTAAAFASAPARRARSAKVTSRIAFAIATPTAMIAPMNDWMFSVVPVSRSATTVPAITAGVVDVTISASLNDWKFAASNRKITTTASASPVSRPSIICSIGTICPRSATLTRAGGSPSSAIAARTSAATEPRSPSIFAVTVIIRCML